MSTNHQHGVVQRVYDRVLRHRLPRRLAVCNGVVTPRQHLIDRKEHFPNYEAELVDALRANVEAQDTVVEIGAGFGVSAVWAARLGDEVTTYEPSAEHVDVAREAARLNDVSESLAVRHAAVGPAKDTKGSIADAEQLSVEDIPVCDVLVMDCEGAERTILRNLGRVEEFPRVVIVETHPHKGAPNEWVRDWLASQDFEIRDEQVHDRETGIRVITARRM